MEGFEISSKEQQTRVRFPIFRRLDVNDYGLYPGGEDAPGLHINFKNGLTLVVGTNGLGKTTLVTLLYRMLSGGYELSRSTLNAGELGGADLDFYRMKAKHRGLFADRVNDRAAYARAVLEVDIGETTLTITRRLDNLGLVSLLVNGEESDLDDDGYRDEILRLSGLSSFGDWLMFLRQMVFYFEDRRSLVWDASAQRQVFRMLFLPPEESKALYEQERSVLELDSRVRNLSASLFRLQHRIAEDEVLQYGEADVRSRIQTNSLLLEADQKNKTELLGQFDLLDEQRRSLRRDLLSAEDFTSRLEEELESNRLRIVYSYFPDKGETAKYLLSILMSDGHCAVCSSENTEMAADLNERVHDFACVLCGANTYEDDEEKIIPIDQVKLAAIRDSLSAQKERVSVLQSELRTSARKHKAVGDKLIHLTDEMEDRERVLNTLMGSLPAEEERQIKAKEELSVLKEKIVEDRVRLAKLSENLSDSALKLNAMVENKAESIKKAFIKYAEGFLFESVSLKWTPQMSRVGQLQKIETASFELDMSGTDFQQSQHREGPGSVSESQREFIDLAFRMALIEVAGQGTGGSLIIDAPESSLDAVFVERAADVLCRFGSIHSPNRLVIASNLVDGRLLPRLISQGVPKYERDDRIVNLMDIAVPTAAIKAEEKQYRREWADILEEANMK